MQSTQDSQLRILNSILSYIVKRYLPIFNDFNPKRSEICLENLYFSST